MSLSTDHADRISRAARSFTAIQWYSAGLSGCMLLMTCTGVVWLWRHWGASDLSAAPMRVALPLTGTAGIVMAVCAWLVWTLMSDLDSLIAVGQRACISKSGRVMFSPASKALTESILIWLLAFVALDLVHSMGLRTVSWLLRGASPPVFGILASVAATAMYIALVVWNLRLTRLCGIFLSALDPAANSEIVNRTVRHWRIVLADMAAFGAMELYFHATRPGGPWLWALAWLVLLAFALYASVFTVWLLRCVANQLRQPPAADDLYPYVASPATSVFHKLDCQAASAIPDFFTRLLGRIREGDCEVYRSEAEALAAGKKPCWKCQPDKYAYVASRNGGLFHKSDCPHASTILPENAIGYNSETEAVAGGKRPCWRCSQDAYEYVAWPTGSVFHRLDCRLISSIQEENCEVYRSEAEARVAAKVPCSVCLPDRCGQYVAPANSPIFHKQDCREIPESTWTNMTVYQTEAQAIADGKRPCWQCQKGKYEFVAMTTSGFYHKSNCKLIAGTSPDRCVVYNSEAEARSDGKTPCVQCVPAKRVPPVTPVMSPVNGQGRGGVIRADSWNDIFRNHPDAAYMALVNSQVFHKPYCIIWPSFPVDCLLYRTRAEAEAGGKTLCPWCT